MMRGNGSLVSWYQNTSHSYSRRRSNGDKEEGIEVSLGEESHRHISLEISRSSSINYGCPES